jgi:hypothetical protein
VRFSASASRSTRTLSFSPTSWKAKRRGGSEAVTTSVPAALGLRSSVGSFEATICQRAPAAAPRRSGVTPETPGYQSVRW